MTIRVECPEGETALREWLSVHDRVYAERSAHHLEFLPLLLPVLTGESPFARGRRLRPFLAFDRGESVARALAVVDERYVRHWGERLGHVLFFEAMPSASDAARAVLDAACEWLREQGVLGARAGFGMLEMPFVIDDYDSLPPLGVRQNPPQYHGFLKSAGFEAEKGWVDYRIEVTPARLAWYEEALDRARRAGFAIERLRDVPRPHWSRDFVETYNHCFARHWGFSPFTEEDLLLLVDLQIPLGVLETSHVAYRGAEAVGAVWVAPDSSPFAARRANRVIRPDEKLNFLGIGVHESARGQGVNLALASAAFLELVRRGAEWLSYTMVLDDNWPSRRTAEKLGASVRASYLVYRRTWR